MQPCRRRNQASVVAADIMGWCKVEDAASLILIASTCAGSEPDREGWHGTALTCKKDVQLKSFRWERKHLLICSATALLLRMRLNHWKLELAPDYSASLLFCFGVLLGGFGREEKAAITRVCWRDSHLFEFSQLIWGAGVCQDQNRKTEAWISIVKAVVIKPVKHNLCSVAVIQLNILHFFYVLLERSWLQKLWELWRSQHPKCSLFSVSLKH